MTATRKPHNPQLAATKRPSAKAVPSSALDSFNEICWVRIELLHTDPLIWRDVEVPTSVTLKVLHDIVQIVMGWFDCHLWEFTIDRRTYGLPMDENWGTAPRVEAIKVRLRDVLKPRKTTIEYLYDMGDNWEHRLTITNIRQGEPDLSYPRYVAGELAAPPEDCGGIPGFYNALDAMADPTHPEHAEITEWLDGYDPKEIEELPLKIALGRIANRRNAARKRLTKTDP
jgi:Plasmid pRiA4b ORF-3-like protein